jgi:hypothetical protein
VSDVNLAEEFLGGKIACEVDACTRPATSVVQDLGSIYGSGPFPIDVVPVGPKHFWCDLHKRDHHSFRRVNGQWVRF